MQKEICYKNIHAYWNYRMDAQRIIFSEFVLDENAKMCHIFATRSNLLLSSFFQFEVL